MTSYTKRRWEISIDDELFIAPTDGRQFKMTFEVVHDFGGSISYCDLAIYNLSADTANNAFKKGSAIRFKAGYSDTIDAIFVGTIKNVLRERRGPNTITRLICRGGRLTDESKTINETLGAGAKVTDIIRACVKALDYPIVIDDSQFSDIDPYPRGYVLNGDPRVYLDTLSTAHNFSYMIENNRAIVIRNDSFRQGEVHIVSQFTGMEGIPEITEVGADVIIRLNPKIRIGGRYRIESTLSTFNFSNLYFQNIPESAGKGEYRIFRISHSGDSWGDAWSTKIVGFR